MDIKLFAPKVITFEKQFRDDHNDVKIVVNLSDTKSTSCIYHTNGCHAIMCGSECKYDNYIHDRLKTFFPDVLARLIFEYFSKNIDTITYGMYGKNLHIIDIKSDYIGGFGYAGAIILCFSPFWRIFGHYLFGINAHKLDKIQSFDELALNYYKANIKYNRNIIKNIFMHKIKKSYGILLPFIASAITFLFIKIFSKN